ncbi:uncharacterized protein L969DRAFT_92203 [Mixia osmundae IAM 14324]|uniref:uncharacterized protein n=1 Tax=Mixia osmundae (strain CBS 9802 / IAM 14324 / JCM 22182 / KY 12970) TaxID=764103 RepID=UPI0004A54AE7|nr:uncharacterized protein L969DRAFT_92203 [Mixia osmundae IAM 14324]KEI42778.1 hypothetical protein L969DRAFT_92203 [Mixia osmundae IAM 14324]
MIPRLALLLLSYAHSTLAGAHIDVQNGVTADVQEYVMGWPVKLTLPTAYELTLRQRKQYASWKTIQIGDRYRPALNENSTCTSARCQLPDRGEVSPPPGPWLVTPDGLDRAIDIITVNLEPPRYELTYWTGTIRDDNAYADVWDRDNLLGGVRFQLSADLLISRFSLFRYPIFDRCCTGKVGATFFVDALTGAVNMIRSDIRLVCKQLGDHRMGACTDDDLRLLGNPPESVACAGEVILKRRNPYGSATA